MRESLSVLMIEDDSQDAELVRLELERGGFELDWVRVETETDLRQQLTGRAWDLIVSDFAMPTFDGLRAFEVYREMKIDIPFIFVSGALGEERAVAAMRAGARDYLLKGNLGRLTAAVRRELKEAANRQSLAQAELASRHKQQLLEAALAATDAGLLEYSIPENEILFASERLAEILGYRVTELLAEEPVLEWLRNQIHPLDVPASDERYRQFVAGQLPSVHSEVRMRHNLGHWVHTAWYTIAVAWSPEGTVTQAVAVVLDTSEAKLLLERYLHAQKMEAIGKLAGGIAHDFNNLLTVIISFAGFVRDDLSESDGRREDIGEVLLAADRAAALTRQLLLFSRQQPANLRPVDTGEAINKIQGLLNRTIGEDIDLDVVPPDESLLVLADPGQFDQIIMNLVVNARDAMPSGGSIRISLETILLGNVESSPLDLEPGAYVQVSVADTGHGIDDQTVLRIFEPFFTTKGPQDGTGLGLATSYGIARQFGGVIDVTSKVGAGTTFKVILPLFEGNTPTRPRVDSGRVSMSGTETILVIEDEEALRRIIERSLQDLGYTVLLAHDAPTGMALFEEHRADIDLLFSDIVLPKGNGFELAEAIRKAHPELPILLTSGYSDRRAFRTDAQFEILWKPYTPLILAKRIRASLGRGQQEMAPR